MEKVRYNFHFHHLKHYRQERNNSISLVHKGLPGDSQYQIPSPQSVEVAATESMYRATDLDSGYYSVAVEAKDANQETIAGAVNTVLVLPNQTSTGECALTISDPSLIVSITPPSLELQVESTIGVERYLNIACDLVVPILYPSTQGDLRSEWFQNGQKAMRQSLQ